MSLAKKNDFDGKSITLVEKYRAAAGRTHSDYNYRGLRIHTLYGLHEYVAGRILEYLEPGQSILDLGAGSGAMSLRLRDLGFKVTSADLVSESFALRGRVPFKCIDLNTPFSAEFEGRYDGIIAIEIIEHVENPRHFIRECGKLLKPRGTLLITTPNIDNPVSKALFVRQGSFMWFSNFNYETEGHITPISQWLLDKLIKESGMTAKSLTTFGNPYESVKKSWKILYVFAKILERIARKSTPLMGEILVVALTLSDFF